MQKKPGTAGNLPASRWSLSGGRIARPNVMKRLSSGTLKRTLRPRCRALVGVPVGPT